MRENSRLVGRFWDWLTKGPRREPRHKRRQSARRLQVEHLEQRQLLSAAGLTIPPVPPVPPIIISQATADRVVPFMNPLQQAEGSHASISYSIIADTNPLLFAQTPQVARPGLLIFQPAAGMSGTSTLTIRATDSQGQTVDCTVPVDVQAATSAPADGISPSDGVSTGVSPSGGAAAAATGSQPASTTTTPVSGSASLAVSPATSGSTTLYWDPTHTCSTNGGGSGSWIGYNNWYNQATNSDQYWSDGSTAVLGGTAGTVTLGNQVSPSAINFNSNYTITAGSGGSLVANASYNGGIQIGGSQNVTATIAAQITGSGYLAFVNGTGTTILSTTNNYTGGTIVSAGTLQIGSQYAICSSPLYMYGGTLDLHGYTVYVGSLSGNGTITANSASTSYLYVSSSGGGGSTYSGNITGNVGLLWYNSGTLALSGNDSYSGGTWMYAGTLQINSANALSPNTAVTLAANTTLSLGYNGTAASLNGSGSVALHTSTFTVGSGTYSGAINSSGGGLTKTGSGTLTLSGNNTYTGPTTINGGVLKVSASGNLGSGAISLGAGTLDATSGFSLAQNISLGSSSSTIEVDSGTLTAAGVISGTGYGFTKTGVGTLTLGGQDTYSGVTAINSGTLQLNNAGALGSTSSVTVLGGATLDLYGRTMATAYPLTLNGNGVGNAGALINSNTTTAATWPGNVTLASNTTIGGANTLTISGVISGSSTLQKAGTGTLTLSGSDTGYTGATTISAGTLQLGNANALGSGNVTVVSGATLDVFGTSVATTNLLVLSGTGVGNAGALINSSTTTTASWPGNVTLASNATIGGANTLTVSGAITDNNSGYALTKTGLGTLTLSGNNNYIGGTTVSGGNLVFAGTSSIPSGGTILINSPGALNVIGAYTTVGGWLSSGKIATSSTGALALCGNSIEQIGMTGFPNLSLGAAGIYTYDGLLTPNNSVYRLGGGGGTLTATRKLTGSSNSLVVNGNVVLTANNDYTGSTNINSGVLQVGNGGTSGGLGSGAVIDNGVLAFDRSDGISINQAIGQTTGAGSVVQQGTGTLTLGGADTYTGGTTINAGNLAFGSSSVPNTGQITINSGGALNVSGAFTTVSQALASGEIATTSTGALALCATVPDTESISMAGYANLSLGTTAGANTTYSGTAFTPAGGVYRFGGGGGTLTVSNALSGSTSNALVVVGNVTLPNASGYTGGTTINAGNVVIGNSSALGSGSLTVNGGMLDLNGNNIAIGSLSGAGGLITNNSATPATLSVTQTASTSYSGLINDGNAPVALTMTSSSTGTLALSGGSTLSGGITVNGGVLDATGSLGSSPSTSGSGQVVQPGTSALLTVLNFSCPSSTINGIENVNGLAGGLNYGNDGQMTDGSVDLTGNVANVITNTLVTLTVNWGDGGNVETFPVGPSNSYGFSIHHVYEQAKQYTVLFTASDNDDQSWKTTFSVNIVDAGPTGNVDFGGSGDSYYCTAYPNEPGIHSFTYRWTDREVQPITTLGTDSTLDYSGPNVFLTSGDEQGFSWATNATSWHHSPFSPDLPTLTVTENDPNTTVPEGTPAHFTITASGSLSNAPPYLYCFYKTKDGTAKGIQDYWPSYGAQFVQLTWNGTDYSAQITVDTTADAVSTSGGQFSLVVSDLYDPDSACGLEPTANASATATIVHTLATDADNDSSTGIPDGDAEEALYKDVSPGKIIAVQKVETDGQTPDPNTRLVPIQVTIPASYTGILTYDSGLQLWTGGTTGSTKVAEDATVSASITYYVEALQAGQFKVHLKFTGTDIFTSYQYTYLSDEALFTAIGQNTGTCSCCNSGTQADNTGQVDMDQTFAGGDGNVYGTSLSQAAEGGAVSVSYADNAPDDDNLAAYGSVGQNMSVGDQPYLVFAGNAVVEVNGSGLQIWDADGSTWLPRKDYQCDSGVETQVSSVQGTMAQLSGNFVETDSDGTKWTFDGFSGVLISQTPPGGGGIVTYVSSGGVLQSKTTQTGSGHTQIATYSYNGAGQLTTVTVTQDSTIGPVIQSAAYAYYGQNLPYDPSGAPGDLQTVTTYNAAGAVTDTTYYRYYTDSNYDMYDPSDPTGVGVNSPTEIGHLKFIFNTDSLVRMTAAGIDYLTATDSAVAPYADQFYQYNSDGSGQVITNVVQGSGATTYANYTNTSGNPQEYPNVWANEQVKTQHNIDGTTTTTTTYTNYRGDVLLTDVSSGGKRQDTYNVYDNYGNLIETAHPSAIQLCSIGNGSDFSVTLSQTTGLIDVYAYYTSTTATVDTTGAPPSSDAGGVVGYLQATGVQNGTGNAPVWQSSVDYVGEQLGGTTVYETCDSTQYQQVYQSWTPPTPTSTPNGANTTTTMDSFYPIGGAIQVPTVNTTTTLAPPVPTSYHGSSTNVSGTITSVNSSGVVTVNAAGTGYQVGQWISIQQAQPAVFDGWFQVKSVAGNTFTYAVPAGTLAPTSNSITTLSTTWSIDVDDTYGRVVWSQDAAGYVSYTRYDPVTGAVIEQIQDVNPSYVTTANGFTAAEIALWNKLPQSVPANGRKNLVTKFEVDSQGRTIWEQDPDGNITCTVYNDALHETMTYPGWHYVSSTVGWQTTGPIQVSRQDLSGTYSESLSYAWTGTTAAGGVLLTTYTPDNLYVIPTGGEFLGISSGQEVLGAGFLQYAVIQSLSRSITNNYGQTISQLQYAGLTGTSYVLSTAAFGTKGANYLESDTFYDDLGRTLATVSPAGAVDYTVYDAFGRTVQEWKGTNTATNVGAAIQNFTSWLPSRGASVTYNAGGLQLYLLSQNTFDADGNQIEFDAYVNPSGGSQPWQTYHVFDWRDRDIIDVNPQNDLGDVTYSMTYYDNQGEAVQTQEYLYKGTNAPGAVNSAQGENAPALLNANDTLLAQNVSEFDSQGRVYESLQFNLASSHYLPTDTWYDSRGNVAATQTGGGPIEKSQYNSVGQLVFTYTCADSNPDTSYSGMTNLQSSGAHADTVVQQTQTWYDADGNTVATATYQSVPGVSPATGALSAADSYVTATTTWYDAAGRDMEDVNFGRQDVIGQSSNTVFFSYPSGSLIAAPDGNPLVAEGAPPVRQTTLPNTYLVTQTAYTDTSAAGPIVDTTDNAGVVTETRSDLTGRTIRTIQDYIASGFDSSGNVLATAANMAQDVTTDSFYDYGGRLVETVAYNVTGSTSSPVVTPEATKYLYASPVDPSLQTIVIAPDSTDAVSLGGNGDWTITTGTDHTTTTYNLQGEPLTSTDQRGVTHTYSYDSAGRVTLDSATVPSGVANSVLSIGTSYDDLGRALTVTSYSASNGGGTIVNQVQNAYDGWSNLAQQWQSVSGQVAIGTTPLIQYDYSDGAVSGVAQYVRLTDLLYPNRTNNTSGRKLDYNYAAGVDAIMSRLSNITTDGEGTPNAAYTYLGADSIASETYPTPGISLDYSANNFAALDRFGRVLDQAWKQSGTSRDEYTYLYNAAGDRTSRSNALTYLLNEGYQYDALNRLTQWSVNGTQKETWSLDALGNDTGAGTYDANNEETPTSGYSGYDLAGNMTTLLSGDTAIYDAWNRLVQVNQGSTIVETCSYDGTNRRIQVATNFSGNTPGTVESDYYSGQQVVESDLAGGTVRGYQYVWSPLYIDSAVLRDTLNSSGTGIIPSSRVFYLADANYNVTALVSGSGQVLERYTYTPYGVVTYRDATTWNQVGSSTAGNTVLFAGRVLDAAISASTYYVRARFYDAALQRFISTDPMGYRAGDHNLYRYVLNNPVIYVDPTGRVAALINGLGNVNPNWGPAEKALKAAGHTVRIFKQVDAMAGAVAKWIRSIYDANGGTKDKCVVIIAGHSYGGYGAVTTTEDLNKAPIVPVAFLGTFDAVPPARALLNGLKGQIPLTIPQVPNNVRAADNFYETTGMSLVVHGRTGFGAVDHDVSAALGWTEGTLLPPAKPSNPPGDDLFHWVHHVLVVEGSYGILLPNRNNMTWVDYAASL